MPWLRIIRTPLEIFGIRFSEIWTAGKSSSVLGEESGII